jgi:hypothetical protein
MTDTKLNDELRIILKRARNKDIVRVCLSVSDAIQSEQKDELVNILRPLIRNFDKEGVAELLKHKRLECSCTKSGVLGLVEISFVTRISRPNMKASVWKVK